MADTVTTNVVFDGDRRYAVQLMGKSDGTGETAVAKILASSLTAPNGEPLSYLTLREAVWDVQGYSSIELFFDATADQPMLKMSLQGFKTFDAFGGLVDPKAAGFTGNVNLTSNGAALGATYDICLSFTKNP